MSARAPKLPILRPARPVAGHPLVIQAVARRVAAFAEYERAVAEGRDGGPEAQAAFVAKAAEDVVRAEALRIARAR